MRGGYQIINFQNVPITTGTAATIPGIYNAIKGSYNKATMFSGMVLDSAEVPDFFCKLTFGATGYTGTLDVSYTNATTIVAKKVLIASNDAVTITTVTITKA